MKLFFDDVRDPPDSTWMVARTVPEAKQLMKDYVFDVMSLDHDIGFQMMCDQCYAECDTNNMTVELGLKLSQGCHHMEHGTTLAEWMVRNLQCWPDVIIIHSANKYGAQRMKDILAAAAPVSPLILDFSPYVISSIGKCFD